MLHNIRKVLIWTGIVKANPVDILVEARALLKWKGWTQYNFARDKRGHVVGQNSLHAASFCSIGALKRAEYNVGSDHDMSVDAQDILGEYLLDSEKVIRRHTPGEAVIHFNDHVANDKKQIIYVFDRAIEKAKRSH